MIRRDATIVMFEGAMRKYGYTSLDEAFHDYQHGQLAFEDEAEAIAESVFERADLDRECPVCSDLMFHTEDGYYCWQCGGEVTA